MKTLRWIPRTLLLFGAGLLAAAGSMTPSRATAQSEESDARTERRNQNDDQQRRDRDRQRNRQSDDQNASLTEPHRPGQQGRDNDHGTDSGHSTANRSDSRDQRNQYGRDQTQDSRQQDPQRQNQNQYRNQNQSQTQRQANSQNQGRTQNQGQAQNQNQRQRFGVVWADDDERWTVDDVSEGSIAARAGLRPDDEVISLNGRQIASSRDFMRALNGGQRASLVVYRDGRRQTLWLDGNAQQGYSNQQFAQNQSQQGRFDRSFSQNAGQWQDAQAFLGVQLNDNYPNLAVVKQVIQNSPAQQAGLQPGDTITSVNGQRVSSPQELTDEVQQLQPGDAVQIQFSRPQMRSVQIRLAGRAADASQASYQSSDQDRSDRSRSQDRTGSSSEDDSQSHSGSSNDDSHDHDD